MSDLPERAAFLATIEATLRDKVIPSTSGDARFAGLMAASAIGMAKREMALEERLAASARDVKTLAPEPSPFDDPCTAIVLLLREGMMDGQDDIHQRLLVDAINRTAVTRPLALSEDDKTIADLE